MITITINQRSIQAPEGRTILQIARDNGIYIPTLCYLEDVSDIGMCRLCMVEAQGYGQFLPACRTVATDGMVIATDNEALVDYRREMLDMILSNHALDCMSCAANGGCELQDLCNRFDVRHASHRGSRAEIEGKAQALSENPFIAYDPGKCIHCQRCVNACHAIACNGALGNGRSGVFHLVDAPFGQGYKLTGCESCGNCASVCPTGALRLKQEEKYRNWEVSRVRTTCPHCATGCQFDLLVKDGRIVNVEAADGPSNHRRLCVKGRSGSYDFVHSPDRLTDPLIRDRATGQFRKASWEEAIAYTARRLMEIKAQYGGDALAGFACSRSPNEDIYMVQKMVRTCFGTNNTDNCARVCHSATVAGLAEAFSMTTGAASKLTKRLLARDLVTRYQKLENRKEVYFRLSPQGEELFAVLAEIRAKLNRRDEAIFADLDEGVYDAILRFARTETRVAFAATVEFVTSPAFPVFLASLVVSGIALIDVIRILWGHVRDKTLREMHLKEFVRPAILCLVAFLLFAVACIMTGSMLYTWWQSIETDVST